MTGLDGETGSGASRDFSYGPVVPAVSDASFPARVAALLRSRPLSEAAFAGERQGWPEQVYDIASFALAAIDTVIASQGFEEEATYEQVTGALALLAARAAPSRQPAEHQKVAAYTVDSLLNRANREAEFAYRISDYSSEAGGHRQREVRFRLLLEREDAARGEIVLNATRDAIIALIGGLEFDVEDEQVANEILLERQLARGAFDAAERAAVRARLLSVRLADDLDRLIRETRRDLRTVVSEWATTVPQRLDESRDHIESRLESEHRLRAKVSESLEAGDAEVAESAARIANILGECQRRHEALHRRVIGAREVFLDEQNRQVFRPAPLGYLPDLPGEVLRPLLTAVSDDALAVTLRWITDVSGPVAPRLPRLHRVTTELLTIRDTEELDGEPVDEEELEPPEPPVISPSAVAAAARAVQAVGLPARLSTVIVECLTQGGAEDGTDAFTVAEIVALAALWCYAPEDVEPGESGRQDLTSEVLGARAAVDSDGTRLKLPRWTGDDLILAPFADALELADPSSARTLPDHLSRFADAAAPTRFGGDG
jgi:hypothetical protein